MSAGDQVWGFASSRRTLRAMHPTLDAEGKETCRLLRNEAAEISRWVWPGIQMLDFSRKRSPDAILAAAISWVQSASARKAGWSEFGESQCKQTIGVCLDHPHKAIHLARAIVAARADLLRWLLSDCEGDGFELTHSYLHRLRIQGVYSAATFAIGRPDLAVRSAAMLINHICRDPRSRNLSGFGIPFGDEATRWMFLMFPFYVITRCIERIGLPQGVGWDDSSTSFF